MHERYEIRVRGCLGPLLRVAFDEMRFQFVPSQSTICGELSEGDLDRLLRRLDQTGLQLVRLDIVPGR